jgi:hypothetical protein
MPPQPGSPRCFRRPTTARSTKATAAIRLRTIAHAGSPASATTIAPDAKTTSPKAARTRRRVRALCAGAAPAIRYVGSWCPGRGRGCPRCVPPDTTTSASGSCRAGSAASGSVGRGSGSFSSRGPGGSAGYCVTEAASTLNLERSAAMPPTRRSGKARVVTSVVKSCDVSNRRALAACGLPGTPDSTQSSRPDHQEATMRGRAGSWDEDRPRPRQTPRCGAPSEITQVRVQVPCQGARAAGRCRGQVQGSPGPAAVPPARRARGSVW